VAEIFISYKSERRKAARHLAKVLGCYGFDAWYDYGLIPGEDFELRLMSELGRADAVIVLWCDLAVKSEWVAKEARAAREQDKFLPSWIKKATLPEEFAGSDTIDLSGWDGAPRSHHLDRILGDLSRRLKRDPVPNFYALKDLDEDWRGFGQPSLGAFALGEPPAAMRENISLTPRILGDPPLGLSSQVLELWSRAQVGNAEALTDLGIKYSHGSGGLPEDEREAARLYKLAADQGHARGLCNLGFLYHEGRGGLPKDRNEAARLYKLAADKGNNEAAFLRLTLGKFW